jgi:RND family efflux transporter MFP subunit
MSNQDPAQLSERLAAFRLDPARRTPQAAPPSRKWLFVAAIGLVVVAGASGAWLQARFAAPPQVDEPATAAGQTMPADTPASNPGTGLDVSGFIVARRQATLSSKISGMVAEVLIEEGSQVRKGDPLVILDDKEAKSSVALAEVGVRLAKANVLETQYDLRRAEEAMKRSEQLAARQLVSTSARDELRFDVEGLRRHLDSTNRVVSQREHELAVVRASLENTIIRAPFDGTIIATTVQPGEVVAPLSAVGASTRSGIGTIMDPASLEVSVEMGESFLSRVRPMQAVVVRPDAYPDLRIDGEVVSVAPMTNRGAASVPVRIRLKSLDPRLLPDMAVSVSWVDSQK